MTSGGPVLQQPPTTMPFHYHPSPASFTISHTSSSYSLPSFCLPLSIRSIQWLSYLNPVASSGYNTNQKSCPPSPKPPQISITSTIDPTFSDPVQLTPIPDGLPPFHLFPRHHATNPPRLPYYSPHRLLDPYHLLLSPHSLKRYHVNHIPPISASARKISSLKTCQSLNASVDYMSGG